MYEVLKKKNNNKEAGVMALGLRTLALAKNKIK